MGVAAPAVEGDFEQVKHIQSSNNDDPFPDEAFIFLFFPLFMGMAIFSTVVMETKGLRMW